MRPSKPSGAQCSARDRVTWRDDYTGMDRTGFACWYPQMGGYVACCVVEVGVDQDGNGERDGFDAWIWHDGEFPFAEDREPICLHHCSAEQFIEFGTFVQGKIDAARVKR